MKKVAAVKRQMMQAMVHFMRRAAEWRMPHAPARFARKMGLWGPNGENFAKCVLWMCWDHGASAPRRH